MQRWTPLFATLLLLLGAILLPAAGPRGTMIEGTVMNAGEGSLFIIAVSGEHMEFVVPDNARIMRDGQAAKLEELQPRDHVTVAATGSGSERIATEIFAKSPY